MAERDTKELLELTTAIEAPLAQFDYWLNWAGSSTARAVQDWVEELVGRNAQSDCDVLRRLVLTFEHPEPGEVKRIAEQYGVTPAAITQRRNARAATVDAVSHASPNDDPEPRAVREHPLTELWRHYARRAVRITDLPAWMQAMLEPTPADAPWGVAHDIAHALITLAMGRPRFVLDADGARWITDQRLLGDGDTRPLFRELAEVAADRIAGSEFTVLSASDLVAAVVNFGISPRSTQAFRQQMQSKPARRTVEYGDRVLVMSAGASKTGGAVARLVMNVFDLSESEAIELVAEAHERSPASIRNDLRGR